MSGGIAVGKAHLLDAKLPIAERHVPPSRVESELRRLERAAVITERQLGRAHAQLAAMGDPAGAEIAGAYRLMVRDPELLAQARSLIADQLHGAEWAVRRALDRLQVSFSHLPDSDLRERVRDIEDVGERLLRTLLGLPARRLGSGDAAGAVAVAVDLSPLDVLQLHRRGVVGFATETGGKTAHAAIFARALGLAYVAGVEGLQARIRAGDYLVVDGFHGEVIARPDDETMARYEHQRRAWVARERGDRAERTQGAVTADGVVVNIFANVQGLADIPEALDVGAEGVGLFRTELLYLEGRELPSEDEQFRDAVAALGALEGRPATFRTLDIGAGKLPAGVRLPDEPNPALGIRSIRFSLRRPDVFKTQLRALYRAGAQGPLRIVFPLVSGVTELLQVLSVCADVRRELTRSGVPFDPRVPLGAMIETPSAAMTADHLARHVDFLSVGTNDLIQYTFAADRDNDDVAYLYHPLHPAVLRLLAMMVAAANAAGRPMSLCGDMASDPTYTWILLGLGLRELSMAARYIPAVKSVIRRTRLEDARALTQKVLALENEGEVEDLVLSTMHQRLPEQFPEEEAEQSWAALPPLLTP